MAYKPLQIRLKLLLNVRGTMVGASVRRPAAHFVDGFFLARFDGPVWPQLHEFALQAGSLTSSHLALNLLQAIHHLLEA